MSNPAIVRIQVNDESTRDSYNLILSRRKYDLINLLRELDREEHLFLLDALEQARALQTAEKEAQEDPVQLAINRVG